MTNEDLKDIKSEKVFKAIIGGIMSGDEIIINEILNSEDGSMLLYKIFKTLYLDVCVECLDEYKSFAGDSAILDTLHIKLKDLTYSVKGCYR